MESELIELFKFFVAFVVCFLVAIFLKWTDKKQFRSVKK